METEREPQAGLYLVLRLAGREFAIEAGRVQGMMQARGLGEPPGVARVQGRDVRVVQLHDALRLEPRPVSARSVLVLIGAPGAAPDYALLADSVSRVEHIPAHLTRLETENGHAVARVRLGEKWRDVLDLDKLTAA